MPAQSRVTIKKQPFLVPRECSLQACALKCLAQSFHAPSFGMRSSQGDLFHDKTGVGRQVPTQVQHRREFRIAYLKVTGLLR
jgi:hypothetical protein